MRMMGRVASVSGESSGEAGGRRRPEPSTSETPDAPAATEESPDAALPEDPAGWVLLRQARKLIVLIVGGTVVAIGVAMILLPGPAFVVIPAGVAILATEFAWARRLLRQVKARIRLAARKARKARAGVEQPSDI